LVQDEGELSASYPGCFTYRESTLKTHLIGGWVNLTARLDILETGWKSKKDSSAVQPVGLSLH
jgi:hypothetical protein